MRTVISDTTFRAEDTIAMKPTPKIDATRPPCKWWVYRCHRPVDAGSTLCAWHRPIAKVSKILDYLSTEDPCFAQLVAACEDPGCDCDACLRQLK